MRRGHAPSGRSDREGARSRPHEPSRSRGIRRPGPLLVRRHARGRRALLGLLGNRYLDHGERPRRRPRHRLRLGRAEADVADAFARAADSLLVRSLGAGGGLRRRIAQDDGCSRGRRVRPQRLEDVHHERRLREVERRVCEDRPAWREQRHDGVRRPDGRAGRDDREAPGQDGPACNRHVGIRAPGGPHPGREPDRRGGRRLQDRDGDARRDASGNRDRRRRRRAGGVRAFGRVRRRSA